jgi:hypothetical protein
MGRERVEKEMVPESFEDEEGAFDEGICRRQVIIIPDPLTGESREMNQDGDQTENYDANPVGLKISERAPRETRFLRNVDWFFTVKLSGHEYLFGRWSEALAASRFAHD